MSGIEGCKNIKAGGDTADFQEDGPYMTYVVWKSYKHPPALLGGA